MLDPLAPLDKAASWALDHYFDVILAVVIEARAWFSAGEELTADLEHQLYRWQNHQF